MPRDYPESIFCMPNDALLRRLSANGLYVHRVTDEFADPSDATEQIKSDLREYFESRGLMVEGFQRFDLILLGMEGLMATRHPFFQTAPLYSRPLVGWFPTE